MANDITYFTVNGHKLADYSGQHIADAGGKGVKFEDCDFSYGFLERVYLHGASFSNCKFIGTRFSYCNLRSAKFSNCDFSYSNFESAHIAREEIIRNLPYEPNKKRDLIRALRANATSMADQETNDRLLSLELQASRDHHLNVFKSSHSYYQKYKPRDRLNSFFSYCGLTFERALWGFGLSPIRLLFWLCLTIVIAGFSIADSTPEIISASKYALLGLLDLTLIPSEILTTHRITFALLVTVRTIFLGLLVTIIYRRYAR